MLPSIENTQTTGVIGNLPKTDKQTAEKDLVQPIKSNFTQT